MVGATEVPLMETLWRVTVALGSVWPTRVTRAALVIWSLTVPVSEVVERSNRETAGAWVSRVNARS